MTTRRRVDIGIPKSHRLLFHMADDLPARLQLASLSWQLIDPGER